MSKFEITVTEESDTYSNTWTVEATEENLEATKAGLRTNVKPGTTLTMSVRKI